MLLGSYKCGICGYNLEWSSNFEDEDPFLVECETCGREGCPECTKNQCCVDCVAKGKPIAAVTAQADHRTAAGER